MKKAMTAAALLTTLTAAAQWHPAGDRIKTSWARASILQTCLPNTRGRRWSAGVANLNGLWNYAIRPAGRCPGVDGEILKSVRRIAQA